MVIWGLTETFSRLNSLSQFRRKLFYFQSSISPSWFPGDVREQKEETITANFVSFLGFFWCVTIFTKDLAKKETHIPKAKSEWKETSSQKTGQFQNGDLPYKSCDLTSRQRLWENYPSNKRKGSTSLLFPKIFWTNLIYFQRKKTLRRENNREKRHLQTFSTAAAQRTILLSFSTRYQKKKSCDKDNNIDGTTKMIQTRLLLTLVGLS